MKKENESTPPKSRREYLKAWRAANKDKVREHQARAYAKQKAEKERAALEAEKRELRKAKDRERAKSRFAAMTPEEREARKAKCRAYYAANRERLVKVAVEYKKKHRAHINLRVKNKRKNDPEWRMRQNIRKAMWRIENPEKEKALRTRERAATKQDPERLMRRRRWWREWNERRKAKRSVAALMDLDLDALLAYLKRGEKPAWKRRVDYGSRYSRDALIGKAGSMEPEDVRAAELRAYGFARAIEAKEWREAANMV